MGTLTGLLIVTFSIALILAFNDEQKRLSKQGKGLYMNNISTSGTIVIILLCLALIALGERALYDLSRIFVGADYDYFDNLPTIMLHSLVVIPVLVVSILINYGVRNKEKYALALVPYFITSIVLALQLVMEVAVFFTNHHTQIQFYIVMTALVLILAGAIYVIQDKFVRENALQ